MGWFDSAISTVVDEGISYGFDALRGDEPETVINVSQVNDQNQAAEVSPIIAAEQTDTLAVAGRLLPYQQAVMIAETKQAEANAAKTVSEILYRNKLWAIAILVGVSYFILKR